MNKNQTRFIISSLLDIFTGKPTLLPAVLSLPMIEPEAFVSDIPNDSRWVVAYCACPHAASGRVINTLRRYGYKNTAIIDEGILVWAQMGYPVQNGQ